MFVEKKVREFILDVASDSPAPGGGSVSALTAASGAALISMLANLTKTKKGYEEVHAEMEQIVKDCTEAAEKFLKILDEDTKAFDAYMIALRMPKDTEEQKSERLAAMQKAAKGATEVPLTLAREAFKLAQKAEYVLKHGNTNALSDGAVALLMLRAGVIGAIYNVRINLGLIKDQEYVDAVMQETKKLESDIKEIEARLLTNIEF